MMELNGKKYYTAQDIAERYGYADASRVSEWRHLGFFPKHDFIFARKFLWNINVLEKWEKEHGGSLESVRLWLREAVSVKNNAIARSNSTHDVPKSNYEIPAFMFAKIPSHSENNSNSEPEGTDDEFKPVGALADKLLSDGQKVFNEFFNNEDNAADLAEPKPDNSKPATVYYFENMYDNGELESMQSIAPEAQKTETITSCNDDSDVEFFALRERVIKLDGDIAELRATIKDLAGIIADLSMSLSNSAGLLYGRVKVANLKLKRFNDSSTDENSKLEGTDE